MFAENIGNLPTDVSDAPHAYPDFSFDLFMPPQSETNPDVSRRHVVEQALSALSICAAFMYEPSSTSAIPIFTHTYSANKLRWHERYMSAQLPPEFNSRSTNAPRRRKDVVESPAIVADILHEMSVNNHPVFQLVSWLEKRYEDHIGQVAIEDVAADIIVMTHLPQYRMGVDKQIADLKAVLPSPAEPRRPGLQKGRKKSPFHLVKPPVEDKKQSSFGKQKGGNGKASALKKLAARSKTVRLFKSHMPVKAAKVSPAKHRPPYRLAPKRKARD